MKIFKQTPTQNGWLLAVAGWIAILVLATGCNPAGSQVAAIPTPTEIIPTPEPTGRGAGDTLRLLYWEAPEILNPHLTGNNKDLEVSRISYEPLASFDMEGALVPFLAAEIPSLENGDLTEDRKSVTWRLKQDVFWSDGEPFTAEDVRFTYEFIADPAVNSPSATTYEAVERVEVVDEHTVTVHFKSANPVWNLPFVGLRGLIIPKHIFEAYQGTNARNAEANTMPVGTGPYRVTPPGIKPQEVLFLGTDLIQTVKIVYEPNPFFREEDKPYFERVELKGGGTVNEAVRSALQAGEVDFAYNLQVEPEVIAALETEGVGHVIATFGARVEQIALNHTNPNRATASGERSSTEFEHPFFSDKQVRQAVAHAIDREAIAALYGSTGRATSNIIVAPAAYFSPNSFYEYNPEQAQTILDEAGWIDHDGDGVRDKDGVELSLVSQAPVSSLLQRSQQIIQRNLRDIGMEVKVELVEAGVYYGDPVDNPDSVFRFLADIQEYDISTSSPDPGPYAQFWTCDQIPQQANGWSGININRWCNPEYDALFRQSTTELDPDKRRELFIQMNDLLIEDVALVSLVHLAQVSGVSNSINVDSADLTPWDGELWKIKDWKRNPTP